MFSKSISYTKSNLTPIKIFYRFMDICINLMRSLRIYKVIYNISLVLMNAANRKKLLKFYSRFVKKDDLCFDIGANFGRIAGAGIDQHIHFHIVPRWSEDTSFMPVIGKTRVVSFDLGMIYRMLKKGFDTLCPEGRSRPKRS